MSAYWTHCSTTFYCLFVHCYHRTLRSWCPDDLLRQNLFSDWPLPSGYITIFSQQLSHSYAHLYAVGNQHTFSLDDFQKTSLPFSNHISNLSTNLLFHPHARQESSRARYLKGYSLRWHLFPAVQTHMGKNPHFFISFQSCLWNSILIQLQHPSSSLGEVSCTSPFSVLKVLYVSNPLLVHYGNSWVSTHLPPCTRSGKRLLRSAHGVDPWAACTLKRCWIHGCTWQLLTEPNTAQMRVTIQGNTQWQFRPSLEPFQHKSQHLIFLRSVHTNTQSYLLEQT